MFFQIEKNIHIIEQFIGLANQVKLNEKNQELDKVILRRLGFSIEIMESICGNRYEWDDACEFNIKKIGRPFLEILSDLRVIEVAKEYQLMDEKIINKIFLMLYRFLNEFSFIKGDVQVVKLGLDYSKKEVESYNYENDADNYLISGMKFAIYLMPAHIVKSFLGEDLSKFRSIDLKIDSYEKYKEKWSEELNEKEKRVFDLKNNLDQYKTGFNFVGLYKGFKDLGDAKIVELSRYLKYLIVMGIIVLTPLLFEIGFTMYGLLNKSASINNSMLENSILENSIILLPIISLEIILIYFFRIILQNHKEIKTQLIQIELRKTLCRFIQSYAEYSSEIKVKGSTSLEKFENIVFSGLISNSENLPSSFDGIDQISGLIKNMRK